jgi:catechol-2,3-dioxygenase
MPATRVNHAVLYVRDAARSAEFYEKALGLEAVMRMGDQAVFMRSAGSANDHDLGLFSIGDQAAPSGAGRTTVGMYHLAWEVDTLADLAETRRRLADIGALVGQSDHGASKSLYAQDPDGLEFEVMWQVPAESYDPERDKVGTRPLDLDAELARFGADTPARVH